MTKLLLPALLALAACSTAPPDPQLLQLQTARQQYQHQRTATGRTLDSLATTGPARLHLPAATLAKYRLLSPRLTRVSDSLTALSQQLPATGALSPTQAADLGRWLRQQQGLTEWELRRRQEALYQVDRLADDYQLLNKLQQQQPAQH